jgi:hypothetical protein
MPPASKSIPEGSAPASHRVHASVATANSTRVRIPLVGEVTLPEKSSLAYDVVIVGLTAFEVIEPGVGAVLLIGHMFARQRGRSKTRAAIEQALEDAG